MAPSSITQSVDHVMQVPPPPWIHAMSGAIGGALALIVLYPLERIRVEMQKELQQQQQQDKDTIDQVETIEFHSSPLKQVTDRTNDCTTDTMIGESWSFESLNVGIPANDDDDDTFHDTVTDMKAVVPVEESSHPHRLQQQQTILSYVHRLVVSQTLYRGITPVVTTMAISNYIFFYLNEWFKNKLQSSTTTTHYHHNAKYRSLLASCLAGICNVLLTNPLWVSNIRMTTGESQYTNNIFLEMKYILDKYGIQHLWSGTTASLLLVSNPVIHFFIYEQLKTWQIRRQQHHQQQKQITPIQAFIIGAIAKTIATLLTYPIQVTQSLLRMQEKEEISKTNINNNMNEDKCTTDKSSSIECQRYNGTVDCFIQLYQHNGINGLYIGLRAKLIQTVLTAALTFLTYEQIVQVLYRMYQSKFVTTTTTTINVPSNKEKQKSYINK